MEKNNTLEKKPLEKSRLGRGLSSLIPPSAKAPTVPPPAAPPPSAEPAPVASPASEGGVQQIALDAITANTYQPRTEFDETALRDLTESVSLHGILQPVMVRPRGKGRYELVAGERRFRAAREAGLTQIPAVIREMSDEDSLIVALIENIQREDLNAMEAARGYRQLLDQFGITQAELARQIGKSPSTVAYSLSLLRLPIEMQEGIAEGLISMDHGKVLLSVASPERRASLYAEILVEGLSVVASRRRAMEEPVRVVSRNHPDNSPSETSTPDDDVHLKAIEDRLRGALGLRVSIRNSQSGQGKVVISFSGFDELETVIDRIVGT